MGQQRSDRPESVGFQLLLKLTIGYPRFYHGPLVPGINSKDTIHALKVNNDSPLFGNSRTMKSHTGASGNYRYLILVGELDYLLDLIAGFGLTFISGFLVAQQRWLSLFGGLFLCYLGIRTFLSTPSEDAAQAESAGLLRNYLSIFFLTLTNPITILSFAAIFAGLGLAENPGNYTSAVLLVLGVFSGSALWWLLLSFGVSLFRSRLTPLWMGWINRASGVIVLLFGIVALVNFINQV